MSENECSWRYMFENGYAQWIQHEGYVHLQESQSGSNWRQCDDFRYITNLFSSKSCMASCNLWPGSGISYAPVIIRYGCGAQYFSSWGTFDDHWGLWRKEDPQFHQQSEFTLHNRWWSVTSCGCEWLYIFVSIYITDVLFSGAVDVEMGVILSFARAATLSPSALSV